MASDSDFTKPRPGWGCCHLVSFQPEMRYHVPMHAEKKRTKNFAPPLEASVQNTLKTLRDPEMVRRDPQLTFLANGPVDVAAWGQGSTERAPAGTSASHGISMSHSAPTLEFMAGGRRKVASLEPLAQTAPTARGSSTRGSKRGSTSGSSRQRADAARAEAAEAAGGGALRGSSSFSSLPLLRPMAASLVGSLQCGLDRKEKLEAAAETFDGRHGALVTHACERTDAVDREPHNEDIRVAAYIATSELTRHRFFVPERAGGPAAKFEKRDRPKAKPKVKELWTLPKSIWAGRAKWCDAADFYDTEEVSRAPLRSAHARRPCAPPPAEWLYSFASRRASFAPRPCPGSDAPLSGRLDRVPGAPPALRGRLGPRAAFGAAQVHRPQRREWRRSGRGH